MTEPGSILITTCGALYQSMVPNKQNKLTQFYEKEESEKYHRKVGNCCACGRLGLDFSITYGTLNTSRSSEHLEKKLILSWLHVFKVVVLPIVLVLLIKMRNSKQVESYEMSSWKHAKGHMLHESFLRVQVSKKSLAAPHRTDFLSSLTVHP